MAATAPTGHVPEANLARTMSHGSPARKDAREPRPDLEALLGDLAGDAGTIARLRLERVREQVRSAGRSGVDTLGAAVVTATLSVAGAIFLAQGLVRAFGSWLTPEGGVPQLTAGALLLAGVFAATRIRRAMRDRRRLKELHREFGEETR